MYRYIIYSNMYVYNIIRTRTRTSFFSIVSSRYRSNLLRRCHHRRGLDTRGPPFYSQTMANCAVECIYNMCVLYKPRGADREFFYWRKRFTLYVPCTGNYITTDRFSVSISGGCWSSILQQENLLPISIYREREYWGIDPSYLFFLL